MANKFILIIKSKPDAKKHGGVWIERGFDSGSEAQEYAKKARRKFGDDVKIQMKKA